MTEDLPQSAEQMTDILDITAVRGDMLVGYLRLGIMILLALIVLAVLFFVISGLLRWWRSRRDESRLKPHQRALLELERLERQRFLERGEWQAFYFFLTETFKNYLHERFQMDALDKTDADLRSQAANLAQLAGLTTDARMLSALLQRAELAKFARVPGSVLEGEGDVKWLRQFINDSHHAATVVSTAVPKNRVG